MHEHRSTHVAAALIALTVFIAALPAKASTPEVVTKRNGETEVVFRENNCVVYYDARGRLVRANDNCRRQQKQQANAAHMQYRSERDVTSRSREEQGDPEAGFAEWQQRQQAGEEGDPEAGYAEWQRRRQEAERGDPEAGFAEWQRQQGAAQSVPEVRVRRNGQREVIFEGNDCVVNFNPQGKRVKQNRNCSREQVQRADDAMARHRREQDM